jgi:hypothetical protein
MRGAYRAAVTTTVNELEALLAQEEATESDDLQAKLEKAEEALRKVGDLDEKILLEMMAANAS